MRNCINHILVHAEKLATLKHVITLGWCLSDVFSLVAGAKGGQ